MEALLAQVVGGATGSVLPFLDCWARMRRVRGVVPLGMLMMYLPSISAVTRRRFTADKPVPSSAGRLIADAQDGEHMRIRQRVRGGDWGKKKHKAHWCKGTGERKGRCRLTVQCYLPALVLLCCCVFDTVTDRRLSGRRTGVAGGESLLKALAIMRVAAEQEKHGCVNWFTTEYPVCFF